MKTEYGYNSQKVFVLVIFLLPFKCLGLIFLYVINGVIFVFQKWMGVPFQKVIRSEGKRLRRTSQRGAAPDTLDSIMAVPFLNVDGTAANVYPPKYLESALLVLTWILISAGRSSSAVLRQEFYMKLLFASAASTLPPSGKHAELR